MKFVYLHDFQSLRRPETGTPNPLLLSELSGKRPILDANFARLDLMGRYP